MTITPDDIERSARIRAITDNFFFWQGRRFVGLGFVMIFAAFAYLPGAYETARNILLLASIAVALLLSERIGRHYRSEFGRVQPIPGAHARRARLKWLLVYPAMIGSLVLDLVYPLPVLVSGPVWAGGICLYRLSTGGGRDHYLVLAAMLAALAFAPLLAGTTSKPAMPLLLLLLGTGYAVCAWLDDREMRAVLRGA